MLFNTETTEAVQTVDEPLVSVAFPFDWEAGVFPLSTGSPVAVPGTAAIQAWVQLVVRTPPGRYAIYPTDFGADLTDLRQRKAPRGLALSELRRQLQASAAYCPGIRDVGPLTYDGTTISGDILLETEAGTATEVIEIGT